MDETKICHHYFVNGSGSNHRIPESRNRDFSYLFLDNQHVPYPDDGRISLDRLSSGTAGQQTLKNLKIISITKFPWFEVSTEDHT